MKKNIYIFISLFAYIVSKILIATAPSFINSFIINTISGLLFTGSLFLLYLRDPRFHKHPAFLIVVYYALVFITCVFFGGIYLIQASLS